MNINKRKKDYTMDVDQYLHSAIIGIEKYMPGIYNALDNYRDFVVSLPIKTFEDDVYLPKMYSDVVVERTDLYQKLCNGYSDLKDECIMTFAETIKHFTFFLYNWRLNKKVYKFNNNFSRILSERTSVDQILDLRVYDILTHLPFNSVAVSAHINDNTCGFITALDFISNKDFTGYSIRFNAIHYDQMEDPDRDLLFRIGTSYQIFIADNVTIGKAIEDSKITGGNEAVSMLYILLYILSLDASYDSKKVKVYDLGKRLSPRIKDRYKDIDVININNTVSDEVLKSIEDNKVSAHFEYSVIDSDHVFDWVIDKSSEDDAARLKSVIEGLKQELNNTKIDLDNARVEADRYKLMYEELSKSIESEREQLYDLRKSMFDYKENGTSNIASLNITFPYKPSKRIVVFGGHDTWVKEIKPRLPGVKFIDRGVNPTQDMIRYADKIWIQNNALPHSAFYSIMNNARKANIPVKYFSYASAVKCAEQVVMEDMNQ